MRSLDCVVVSVCLCAPGRRDVIMIMTSLHCHYVTSRLCIVCDVTTAAATPSQIGQRYSYLATNIRKDRILVIIFVIH